MKLMGNAAKTTRRKLSIGDVLMEGRAFVALIIIIAFFALSTSVYLDPANLVTMTKHVAINALLALGMLLVILTGGIDLSVGSVVGLSAVTAGQLIKGVDLGDATAYPQIWVVVLVALVVGTLVGLLNGILITRFEVAPFIATLGTMYVARGAAMLITDGETVSILNGQEVFGNTGFPELFGGRPLGIPAAIWLMVLLAVVIMIVVNRTPFGRWLYAVGGNIRASELSGVPVKRVNTWVYMVSGFCAAVAGLVMAAELNSAPPQLGETYELNAIAAVVIGGAALAGGRGNVRGALIGAFVIGFLSDGLVLINVSAFWQMVIKGAVIVLAVILDQAQQRIERNRSAVLAVENKKTGAPATAG